MARIVEPPPGKRVKCSDCGATMEYMPEEVDRYTKSDYDGGSSEVARVKCPRTRCPGYGYVR